jgi:hypothetical protein
MKPGADGRKRGMSKKQTRVRRVNARWAIWTAIAVIVLAGALIAASVISASHSTKVPPTTVASALSWCGGPECGQANAPVTIEIYSDFQ